MARFHDSRPEWIFLLIGGIAGLILCFLIPPLGGGNETFNFERTAAVAYGHWRVEKAPVPSGIVAFIAQGNAFFREGLSPPFAYSHAALAAVHSIMLDSTRLSILLPNPIAVHHPFAYLPQALAMRLGGVWEMRPLTLFWLARLSGMAASLMLTFFAIRIMPSHRYGLCALALLPPILFSRSTVDADQLTIALAFLFTACCLRAIKDTGILPLKAILALAGLAFVLAQCKNVYLLLPLLALGIPRARFANGARKRLALAAITLPGLAASLFWMLLVKRDFLAGMTYHTWAGLVNPDAQSAFIFHHPLKYALVFLRTLFTTDLIPHSLIGILAIFGPPLILPGFSFLFLMALLCLVIAADRTGATFYPHRIRLLAGAIPLTIFGLSLTILYIQWTGLGAPVIAGFQGRYFNPLLPLFLLFARPWSSPLPFGSGRIVIAFALSGAGLLFWVILRDYYG